MATTSTIQVRIDARMKREVKKTLDLLGLDISSAVKMFLSTVVNTQSIPFRARTENGFTEGKEEERLRDISEAERNGKRYKDANRMLADI